jgi:dTDP-4-amino-4,6-dideoxygalactose transaminase
LQAAALLVKLPHLEHYNSLRQEHAAFYTRQLSDVVEAVPVARSWGNHVYCYYVIQVGARDQFRQKMESMGIATGIHYPTPLHLQSACIRHGYRSCSLPVTEAAAKQIVSLPLYPELTEQQRQFVVDAVKQCLLVPSAHSMI